MATSIIINTTRDGSKKQRSVTNIDPSATANNLIDFAQMLVGLSSDVYVSTVRVDKTELARTEEVNNG